MLFAEYRVCAGVISTPNWGGFPRAPGANESVSCCCFSGSSQPGLEAGDGTQRGVCPARGRYVACAANWIGPRPRSGGGIVVGTAEVDDQYCLDSPLPTLIMWGPDVVIVYNDSFAAQLADQHPRALGLAARQFPCA